MDNYRVLWGITENMRIIAGKFKGRSLVTEKGDLVRPTTDRIKENIFNLIQDYIDGNNVLDLFCGSGALGIEALSRGAALSIFVDKSSQAIEILKVNLSKISADYEIVNREYTFVLRQLSREKRKFDVIFVDPPYGQIDESIILKQIVDSEVLSNSGIVVVERRNQEKKYFLPKGMYTVDSRTYGQTTVDIIALGNAVAITGSFDPFTIGHEYLVEKAIENFKSIHIVILNNVEKTHFFPVESRLKSIRVAMRKYEARIQVNCYDGLAIDYCKCNDIKYIIRGIRSVEDFAYESEMAEWNEKMGAIKTLFVPAKDAEISSTLVRKLISEGKDISSFVR